MTRLTEEMVIARSRGGGSDLASIKKLNCWGSELSDVSIIKRMRGVEVLALSVNKISSLAPFEDCLNLQELYLRKNSISDINEIAYLQNLPNLKYLWLEENPCCDVLGSNYRSIVLRALPNLKKLDNVDVTPEEIEEAMRMTVQRDEEVYEDAREVQQQQQQQQPQPQPQQQQQRRSQSPSKEQYPSSSPSENIEEIFTENIIQSAASSSPPPPSQPQPQVQRSPPSQDYSPQESIHPPSPKYNNNNNINNNNNNNRDNRMSYHQYDRSPGSEESSPYSGDRGSGGGGGGGYKDRGPIPPSMSTHSMKEYYQSDYQKPQQPSHYRHSQTDLTEWDEHQHQTQNGRGDMPGRRVGERDERGHGRYSDTASVVSNAVLNHYAGYHRRPVNRSSNLLSATLCLVKELLS
ncbi:cilia- and flagella-associated protein 410 isoform X2 [Condylostylus longicornis]|uniref:cilia- and flagella-associated protein 410 isoform X2 n=1 Tax=Condylostylus longicornis TaxID=2530218 RepID=UPI00244E2EC3|nr:cilia- and flagella-associated protein 410 isoform X2 [Condylostylus longicornis]